jgi:hypothetical protein
MVKVDGDMNLTGLNVRQTSIFGGSGDLNLRNSRIQGRLELYPHARAEDVKPVENATDKTVIDGRLWLDGANIGYMIISGESFTKFAENEHKDEPRKRPSVVTRLLGGGQVETYVRPRVRFERAKIGRLHIMDPLPDTVDLSNLEVARWDLPKQGSMDKFTEMLDRSFPFKKSNYFVIENHLHNIGDDELADKVRISMCKRDQRQSYSVWKLLLNRFLETSIAYGTKSQRLVFIMVAWFTLTMWIFGDQKRVEYDISSSPEKPPSHQIVPAKHWNLKDDFILAARLHVPIIGLGLEDRFHAAHYWPELYAAMTLAAHWVMWPLLLASASGIIRKRS